MNTEHIANPVPDAADDRWVASVPGVAHQLDGRRLLFQTAGGQASHVVTSDLLRAMGVCRAFAPFAEQITRIEAAIPKMRGHATVIRQTLEQLLERGLFVDARSIGERLHEKPGSTAFADQPPLVVRTCDRPAMLARLLDSGIDYEQRSGRRFEWLILDDSKSAEAQVAGSGIARAAAQRGLRVCWLDQGWQRSFVAQLAASAGVDPGLLQWLLLGTGAGSLTTGRTLNLALLLTAGCGFCLLDDDLLIDAVIPPGTARIPRFGNTAPWNVHFPADADAARDFGEQQVADPFAAHLDLCGQALGAALGGSHMAVWQPSSLAGCELSEWSALEPHSRVIGTVFGTRGSPTSQTAHWLYRMADEAGSFSRFVGDAQSYAQRARARWVVQSRAQPTVLEALLTTPLTLDNRQLLPCTLPAGRAEDRVLTTAIAALYPQHVMLDLPDAWLHLRDNCTRPGPDSTGVLNISLCDLVCNYFVEARLAAHSESAHERLAGLARTMADLGTAPEPVRFDVFREVLGLRRSTLVMDIEVRIETFSGPADHPWLADARALADANRQALTDDDAHCFRDRDDVDSRAGVTRLIGEQCSLYARALAAWPTLWAHCNDRQSREFEWL